MRRVSAADLFAGAGGTSTGLSQACKGLGRTLDLVAVNHWALAIEAHKKNHPDARHICASLEGLNPRELVKGGRLNILVASPECTDHSSARGGRPMNDQSRSSAWLILKWLQELYVDNLLIENVAEFQFWGPLGADGRPLKSKRGVLFQQFLASLRALGYNVEWRILNAANYGDPTTRERLFIIGRRGRNRQISWPEATHAQVGKTHGLFDTRKPWRAAREIIDWSSPGTSIFARKRPLATNTLKRILAGMQKFKWPEPFIVVLRQHMAARSLDEPLPTVTAGGTHMGLCEPFVLQQQSGGAPRSVGQPLPTVATGGAISLVEPFILPQFGEAVARDIDRPLGTLTTTSRGVGVVQPFIVPFFGEADGQAPRSHSLEDPLPAVTSHGAGAVVEPFIVTASHGEGTGRRCRSITEPLPTITTTRDHAVVEPFVTRFDQQSGSGGRARSIDSPLPTVTTKNGLAVVEPFVVEMRNGKTANSIEDPLSTVTTLGAHHGIAQPFIDKFYGTGTPADVDEPLDTVTAKERFGLCEAGQTIYDIRFRMLKPRELARAQGFPDSYEFIGGNAAITKMVGNAVPVNLAEALCRELIA